ncbi:MAG: type II toxin-antitoxin system RelE/ParE family toxin [Candidatus Gastranaerophilales bacterium]|nr:type II toxin-antitoxin system RelE/ParE family toxin [Candidatus Gastranaerophilales bacterium]
MKEIFYYKTINGKCPFDDWYNSLDKSIKLLIDRRIDRIEQGNYGYHRRFDNIVEIKFKQGAGYRIYAAEYEDTIIIILCGGDKSKQSNDIKNAKIYMEDIKERFN